jgi:hypothetical protein
MGFAPAHAPAWQLSVCVHASPSLQLDPFAFAGLVHSPDAGVQVPITWHGSGAGHATGFAPTHVPNWQASVWVHPSPSLQLDPLAFLGSLHNPDDGLQVPTSWHSSDATHRTGLAPVHTPDWQVSVRVQPLASSQLVPSAATGFVHAPVAVSQVPTV